MSFVEMEEIYIEEESVGDPNTTKDSSNMFKCGQVFITKSANLLLVCGFCETSYDSMPEFGDHIRYVHLPDANTNETSVYHESSDNNLSIRKDDDLPLKEQHEEFYDSTPAYEIENDSDCATKCSYEEDLVEIVIEYPHEAILPSGSNPLQRARQKRERNRSSEAVSCQFCEKTCPNQDELEEHSKTHDRDRPYTCSFCGKSFTTKSYCGHHMKVIHMGEKPHKCTQCPRSFGTRGKLRAHMLIHSMPGVYSCEVCGRQFIYQSRKDDHMRTHTGEKPFQCEICGQNYILQSRLTEHMKRHNNTKNHECDICGKRFYTNVMLKDHLIMHSSEKPFECPECGQRFSRKKVMKMHMKIHSEIKEYSCDICGKAFAQFAGLYSHKKSHGNRMTAQCV